MESGERSETTLSGKAESILAAAKRAFLANGFGAVSMDAIARDAGVSKATVYAHFVGKEELFGAVIGRECEHRFDDLSVSELDPREAHTSLTMLGRRFLDFILSPDEIALHRIILGEVTRFPALGEVFWRAGPERNLAQIEAFMRNATAAGSLAFPDMRIAAEQFVGLLRSKIQLLYLLRLESELGQPTIGEVVENAVDTFIRAFGSSPPVSQGT